MKRRKEYTWIIATIGISVLLLFQLVLVSRLYQLEREHFYDKFLGKIKSSIFLLNVNVVQSGKYERNLIAYDCALNKVTIVINGVKYFFVDENRTEK